MRITSTGSTKIAPGNGRVIVIRSETPSPFSRVLARKEETIFGLERVELEELGEELQGVGERFENEPTLASFRLFREAMGRFARKAISLAYRLERLRGERHDGLHEVISIIDRNADELYRLVMEGNRDRLAIAARIADINGIIVTITA